MKNNIPTNGLLLYPALLSIWLAISCAAFFYADINTAMAGILILAAVSASSLALGTGILVFSVNLLTIIVYGVMIKILYGIQPSSILVFITFSTAVIGTAYLAWNTSKQFQAVAKKVERDHLLIEEMRIKDDKTGLMRFHYARRLLSTEISRSLRFGKKLVIIMFKIDSWELLAEKIGLDNREHIMAEVSELLFSNCRNIDTLFLNIDKFGVILPETDIDGGKIFAKRLAVQIEKRLKQQSYFGIASFPLDSITDDDLLKKCDTALREAVDKRKEIVCFSDTLENTGDESVNVQQTADMSIADISTSIFDPTGNERKFLPGEVSIEIKGTHSIQDIEAIQKALEKIKEFETVRLIDFEDKRVIFAALSSHNEIPELLLTRLDIPNISIEEKSGAITINLDSSINL